MKAIHVQYVPSLVYANSCNCTKHETIKVSPFELDVWKKT